LTTVSIHQPEYLPWIGFFKKILDSDIFVIYDDIQFEKKDWQNRNQICSNGKPILLSVPIKSHLKSKIFEIDIDNSKNWSDKHKKSIMFSYSTSKFYNEMNEFIDELYDKKFDKLIDLNYEIIKTILSKLNINTKIVFSSELKILESDSNKILSICKKLKATKYITGTSWAQENLNKDDFINNKINLEFRTLNHPIYHQPKNTFLPNMSIIDLLFNEGKISARTILEKSEVITS